MANLGTRMRMPGRRLALVELQASRSKEEVTKGDAMMGGVPGVRRLRLQHPLHDLPARLLPLRDGDAAVAEGVRAAARGCAGPRGAQLHNHKATYARLVAEMSEADFAPVPVPRVDASLVGIRMKEVRTREVEPGINLDEWLASKRVHKEEDRRRTFKQKEMAMGLKEPRNVTAMPCSGGRGVRHDDDDVDDGEEEKEDCCESPGHHNERPWRLSIGDLLRVLQQFKRRGVRFH
ncbi:hypothetical protein C2845_PM03G08070 [Panicum miliaceum]|uniref:Uncharacterized protein n=1 Tax=Panicum miliaceum TaxID=4540 RepID=A0A3L6TB51_PANMI|nr:hypothetical protein C2845_PM03G08070 [Panicum miliaceum]